MADEKLIFGSLRGKVAQILTEREIILNVGHAQGATQGMVFAVLNKRATSIRDPDTNRDLGSLSIPKILVKISVVDQNVSIARTYRSTGSGRSWELPNLFLEEPAHTETLRISEHAQSKEIDEKDSLVKIGDPVVQVVNPPEK